MTACKDSQATSGKKAVSATLAGVLAVGLVPAVALADEAVEVTEEDGITERVVTPQEAFASAKVSSYYNGTSTLASVSPAGSAINVSYTGSPVSVVPVTLQIPVGSASEVTVATLPGSTLELKDGFSYSYATYSDGKKGTPVSSVVNPGSYCVVVSTDSTVVGYPNAELVVPFTVGAASFAASPVVYEVNPDDPTDPADTKFMFTGKALNLAVQVKDATTSAVLKEGTDYTVKFLPAGANASDAGVSVADEGSYYAVITGIGKYANDKATTQVFPVAAFDLDECDIEDVTTTSSTAPAIPAIVSTASGYEGTVLDSSLVKKTMAEAPTAADPGATNGDKVFNLNGLYKYTVEAIDPDTDNITGEADFVVAKVGRLAAFKYGQAALPATFTTDLSNENSAAFDPAKISVFDGSTQLVNTTGAGAIKYYTTTVEKYNPSTQKWDDQSWTSGALDMAGSYRVVTVVNPSAGTLGYAVGGQAVVEVTVTDGSVDADASAYVNYTDVAGKTYPIASLTVPYTGNAIASTKFVPVVMQNGNALPASAYKMAITDSAGKTVSSLVDAGTYTLTLKGVTCNLTGTTTVPIVITKIDLKASNIEVTNLSGKFGFDSYISVGDALSGFGVDYFTGEKQANGDPETKAVSSFPTNVTVAWQKWDEDASKWVTASGNAVAGKYRVAITPNSADALKNFEFDSDEGTFIELPAVDEGDFLFADVVPGTWYFDPIAEAAQPKAKDPTGTPATPPYMNGYAGANLFGPNDAITRGQVACVLYNMAGGDALGFIPSYTENYGVDTGFSDVDGKMYYAKAIAWAKSTGVVNGFAGTDQFGPDDNITREQFAAMLATYAQKRGATLPSDVDGILAGISDGPSTSDWAKASVAWAVENEVMGRGGFVNPFGTASRAEVAAMAVNYQPRA